MNVLLGPCTFESATAKMIAKKTICSTSFFAAASKKLVGTVCSITPVSVVCVAASSAPSFVDAAPRSTPTPGLHEVHGDQPDGERERRDDLEVDDRPEREPADPLHVVAVAGDADDERREQQRHDQRLDHPQEHRRQDVQVRRRPTAVIARAPPRGTPSRAAMPTTIEMTIHCDSEMRRKNDFGGSGAAIRGVGTIVEGDSASERPSGTSSTTTRDRSRGAASSSDTRTRNTARARSRSHHPKRTHATTGQALS